MKIVLRVDGENKTYIQDFVAAINFRNALTLNKEFAENIDLTELETFDKVIEFAASVFEHQFSVEEVWKGLPANEIQSEPIRIFHEVLRMGGLAVKAADDGDVGNEAGK